MGPRGLLPAARPAQFSTTLSPALSVYLCSTVGPQGLLVVRLPAPLVPHSASLGPTMATWVLSTLTARLCPSYQSGWMFIFYLLGVGLPCRSIFCQFCLCEEAQCVYLSRHLGSLKITSKLKLVLSVSAGQAHRRKYILCNTAMTPVQGGHQNLRTPWNSQISWDGVALQQAMNLKFKAILNEFQGPGGLNLHKFFMW